MTLPKNFDDLITEATRLELYSKLIAQLNKDFLLANIDLDFDAEIIPTSLKLMLHETVFKLIQEKFPQYLNLLYIIDVSEEKIRKLDGSDAYRLSEDVALMILQREWQKVWYKAAN